MSAARRIVVIGADAAGMSAAHQALRIAGKSGEDLDVVVLERGMHTSYSACGIPYWIAGDVDRGDGLIARTPDRHRQLGVDLRLGATATRLDRDGRVVHYREPSGRLAQVEYDELVLASGARAVVPDWAKVADGSLVRGVRPVRNIDDGHRWLRLLGPLDGSTAPRRVIVVGGGYVALEMAEAILRRGIKTTLLTRSRVMNTLDSEMGARVESVIQQAGIEYLPHVGVGELLTDDRGAVKSIRTHDGRLLRADAVVLGVGARPASELGAEAGLPLGRYGGYLPDAQGRLAGGIWAAGDCCEVVHRLTGEYTFTPLGTHANKQGRVVGENLAGGCALFGGVLGTAITRFVAGGEHVEIARTGLSSAQAEAAGLRTIGIVTEGSTASGYMPEARSITTKVIADRDTRKLVGFQIVGGEGAGKRIDTAAVTLWGDMTVDQLASMDLAYAPPFATVWDAVQLAARRVADRL